MTIISNNYNLVLKKLIFNSLNETLIKEFGKINKHPDISNYINLISTLDDSLCNLAVKLIKTTFESLDKGYLSSKNRKRDYHIKAYHQRSIITIFGEITFTRTFYTNKRSGKCFCYLDRFLGLKKYDYFDPYLKAMIIDYAADNSLSKTAKMINDLIGNRVKLNKHYPFLSRQCIRHIILKEKISLPQFKTLPTPDNLYIMADEKWIHTQGNNKKDIMTKSIVVFDGFDISNPNRIKLLNKKVFADIFNKATNKALDYIYYTYDVDQFKHIYIMGDGASWIKNLRTHFKFNPNVSVVGSLDRFHFNQALHHLTQDKTLSKILLSYVLENDKSGFNNICMTLIANNSHREDTIINKQNYILNNWVYILNTYKYNLKCSMEAHISHNLAALFTSRPKGYSLHTLDKLLNLRLLYKNGYNLKKLYLNNYNSKKVLIMDDDKINYSIFKPFDYIDTYSLPFNFKDKF